MRFKQGRIMRAHRKLLKCSTEVRNDENLRPPVTYIIILGRTAISKINKFPPRRSSLTKVPQATTYPRAAWSQISLSILWLGHLVFPWLSGFTGAHRWKASGSASKKIHCPRLAMTTQGLRLPSSISQRSHFTTTEKVPFKKHGPLIKIIHQGYFLPCNLWAP